jgi:hypothetical protein
MTELTNNDYIHILEYYKKNIPRSKRLIKMEAEKILATKLCRCIKKVDPVNESKSIGICTKTIINNKGYTRGKFSCKKKTKINLMKKMNNSTRKINNRK